MERHLRKSNPEVAAKVHTLRQEVAGEFGFMSRIVSAALGPVLWWTARREQRRLAQGHTYEPQPIVERRNWVAGEMEERRTPELVTLAAQGD